MEVFVWFAPFPLIIESDTWRVVVIFCWREDLSVAHGRIGKPSNCTALELETKAGNHIHLAMKAKSDPGQLEWAAHGKELFKE